MYKRTFTFKDLEGKTRQHTMTISDQQYDKAMVRNHPMVTIVLAIAHLIVVVYPYIHAKAITWSVRAVQLDLLRENSMTSR